MSDTQEKKNTNALINIDLGSLSPVMVKLLDMLEKVLGWIHPGKTPRQQGLEVLVEELQNSNLPTLQKSAMISAQKKILKEYCNQVNIVEIAMQTLAEEPPDEEAPQQEARPEDVDEDWLFQFMDKARLVSDEEMQLIWGRILAGECNAPGSVPKSLLHILEQMEKSHAETFTALRSISVHLCYADGEKHFYPFYFENLSNLKYYYLLQVQGLRPAAIRELISLGLVVKDEGRFPFGRPIHYYDESSDPEEDLIFGYPVGELVYTQAGQALCRSIRVPREEGFFEEFCIPFWNEEAEKQRKKYEELRKSLQEEKTAGSEE